MEDTAKTISENVTSWDNCINKKLWKKVNKLNSHFKNLEKQWLSEPEKSTYLFNKGENKNVQIRKWKANRSRKITK